jgi:molybdopterin converting factor small subunit
MRIQVIFYSYLKDLAGCAQTSVELPATASLGQLYERLKAQYPQLAAMEKSTLMAVGVEYQDREYSLQPGDEVSLFPPVQGG